MNKILIFITAIFFVTGFLESHAQQVSECIDLFIWAGQSNAQGWKGDAKYYPEDTDSLDASIRLYYTDVDNRTSSNGQWVIMQKQGGRFPSGHFGPEVSFSRELKKTGFNPAIFKYTNGATSIYEHWKLPGQNGMYDDMIIEYAKAVGLLINEGHKVNVRGFVWIQGESDTKDTTHAKAYYKNLQTIITDVRNQVIKDKRLAIILGMDEQFPLAVEHAMDTVLEAHYKLDEEDDDIAFTSMYGLQKADQTHLTPEGLVVHGERIFSAFDSIYSQKLSLPEILIEQGDSVLVFGKYRKEAGIYMDTLVSANGCDSISIQNLVYKSETSTEQLSNEKRFTCYPNPFHDTFCIEYPNIQNRITIEIMDISGRIVMKKEMGNCSTAKVNTARLKPSMYFIRVLNDQKLEVTKAMKR